MNDLKLVDIATPTKELAIASRPARAIELMAEHDYEVVPFRKSGVLVGYFQRGRHEMQSINDALVRAPETPLVEALQQFADLRFLFVGRRRRIVGYAHFSDLNRRVVALSLFSRVHHLEGWVRDFLHAQRGPEPEFRQLSPDRQGKVRKSYRRLVKTGAARSQWNLLSLKELLRELAELSPPTDTSGWSKLLELRNRLAHPCRSLVQCRSDVGELITGVGALSRLEELAARLGKQPRVQRHSRSPPA